MPEDTNRPSGMLPMRPATAGDSGVLLDVFLRSGRDAIATERGWDEPAERARFSSRLDIASTRVLQVGEDPVGFVVVASRSGDVEVRLVCIVPEHQGRGIGSQLIRDIVHEAAGAGQMTVLSVFKSNTRARGLHERLGFVIVGEEGGDYWMRYSDDAARNPGAS